MSKRTSPSTCAARARRRRAPAGSPRARSGARCGRCSSRTRSGRSRRSRRATRLARGRCGQRDHVVAEAIELRRLTRVDHDRREALLDDRRPLDAVAVADLLAVVDGRVLEAPAEEGLPPRAQRARDGRRDARVLGAGSASRSGRSSARAPRGSRAPRRARRRRAAPRAGRGTPRPCARARSAPMRPSARHTAGTAMSKVWPG